MLGQNGFSACEALRVILNFDVVCYQKGVKEMGRVSIIKYTQSIRYEQIEEGVSSRLLSFTLQESIPRTPGCTRYMGVLESKVLL